VYTSGEADNTAKRALYVQAYYWKSGVDPLTGKITAKPQINIMNHSYGQLTPFHVTDDLHGSDIAAALNRTTANGIIHVWSAGNERGKANEDTGKDSVLTNSNVIPVAALGSDGKFSDYSNYGSNVYVSHRDTDTKVGQEPGLLMVFQNHHVVAFVGYEPLDQGGCHIIIGRHDDMVTCIQGQFPRCAPSGFRFHPWRKKELDEGKGEKHEHEDHAREKH
jgi:hypothetical protein